MGITRGYVRADFGDRKLEHIAIAEKALGKKLPRGVVVHHVNENKSDNRNENLVICPGQGYHVMIHGRMKAMAATGSNRRREC